MSNNPTPPNLPLHSSVARNSFIEDLPPSRVPSVAQSRVDCTSVSGLATHSCTPSRTHSIIDLDPGSVNQTDGTCRLEQIFSNALVGSTGPTLADKTFRASQHHPVPTHPAPPNIVYPPVSPPLPSDIQQPPLQRTDLQPQRQL
ncbi:hypothetical protein PCASD_21581 [Puccinia coronata f. sp. avenae]|uniref:Uncharacterized protein n=1 Tax=Puccinia coronata f. sp. avenae TaxID=200324 RepID=A0A2N5UH56_9BASI|nr:hypothetical protein PCASD_21581 [Puccinia coronata f. sp. avenae]